MIQLSLFDLGMSKEEFAQKLCDEFNKIDTVWEFYVKRVSLAEWHHVDLKNKVLEIDLDTRKNKKDKFIYFQGDKQSQMNLYNIPFESEFVGKLNEDKDFSINITPWAVYIYFHNWELKKI